MEGGRRGFAPDRQFVVLVAGLALKAVVLVVIGLDWGLSGLLAAPATVPLATLALAPGLVLHGPRRTAYLILSAAVLSTVLLADMVYARAFGRLLSVTMLTPGASYEGLGESVVALLRPTDALFFLDVLVLLALALRRRPGREPAPRRSRVRRAALVGMSCAALFVGQVLTLTSDPRDRIAWLSPLGFHVYEAYAELIDTNRVLEPQERERVEAWFAANAAHQVPAPEHAHLFGALAGRDVYVIQVESMEEIVLGLEVEGQEVTPTLNGLLDQSLHFTDILQQTRDGNTSDAELLVAAGLYPLDAGSAFLRFPDNDGYTTLPQLAADLGYETYAVHGDGETFWNRDEVYPRLGWQHYVAEDDFAHRPRLGMGIADTAMFDQVFVELDRLAARTPGQERPPVLMSLVTMTSHTPFRLPEHLQELDLSTDDTSSDYLQSMRYVDSAFADFYAGLRERGLLERSAFVVLGDHEGVHKYATDEVWLPENHLRVPLVVHAPGLDGLEVGSPGGQVDIMPTLAFLLGVPQERYAASVMGRNLLGPGSGSGIDSEGHLVPGVDGADLLREAYEVADLAISSDYFIR